LNRLVQFSLVLLVIALPAVAQQRQLAPESTVRPSAREAEANVAPKRVAAPEANTTTDVIGARGKVWVDTAATGAASGGVTLQPTGGTDSTAIDIIGKLPASGKFMVFSSANAALMTVGEDGQAGVGTAPATNNRLSVYYYSLGGVAGGGAAVRAQINTTVSAANASFLDFAMIGLNTQAIGAGASNANIGTGVKGAYYLQGAGTMSRGWGVLGDVEVTAGYTGTISQAIAFNARIDSHSGVIAEGIGLFIEDMVATTGYGIVQEGLNDTNIFKGAVTIGQTAAHANLTVNGDATFSGTVTGGNIKAKYQDFAEWVPATHDLIPGTVVVLNKQKSNEVMASAAAYDIAVAGVVSDQPGLSLGEEGAGKEQVATTGRVRVRVDARTAPIQVGDLLVTSDVPGTAMRSEPMTINGRRFHQPGTIIGKALEPLENGMGEVLVLLSLQ